MTTRVLVGDVREQLALLPDNSVHVVCTSPPYWGLRAYGTEPQVWGGDGNPYCAKRGHDWQTVQRYSESSIRSEGRAGFGGQERSRWIESGFCKDYGCGAWKGELGSEPDPWQFIANLVEVFREVKRVLHPSGTLWLNLGWSYAGSGKGPTGHNGIGDQGRRQGFAGGAPPQGKVLANRSVSGLQGGTSTAGVPGFKPKDLILTPFFLAEALRADGWTLRSVICWAKKSAMPESVQDRPTNAWEPIFLLSKSKTYYFDQEAVRQPWADDRRGAPGGKKPAERNVGGRTDGFTRPAQDWVAPEGRTGANLRNVWLLGPSPFADAHFATFPPEIPRRAILAGASERGCCPTCLTPWRRLTKSTRGYADALRSIRIRPGRSEAELSGLAEYLTHRREAVGLTQRDVAVHFPSASGGLTGCVSNWECGTAVPNAQDYQRLKQILGLDDRYDAAMATYFEVAADGWRSEQERLLVGHSKVAPAMTAERETTGWQPGCPCDAGEPVPATVLDPFAGSGTTGLVADRLGRDAVLIELSPEYAAMARRRIDGDAPLLSGVAYEPRRKRTPPKADPPAYAEVDGWWNGPVKAAADPPDDLGPLFSGAVPSPPREDHERHQGQRDQAEDDADGAQQAS